MSWKNILNKNDKPLPKWSEIYPKRKTGTGGSIMFFTTVFNIPVHDLNLLNISKSLGQMIGTGALDKITSDQFEVLMRLSEKGKYQQLVDKLEKYLAKHRVRDNPPYKRLGD